MPSEFACALMVCARAATPVCLIWLARPKLHRTDVGLPAWMEMGCPSAPRGIVYIQMLTCFVVPSVNLKFACASGPFWEAWWQAWPYWRSSGEVGENSSCSLRGAGGIWPGRPLWLSSQGLEFGPAGACGAKKPGWPGWRPSRFV